MSLYHFHRVLIGAAILFDVMFSWYCYRKWHIAGEVLHMMMLVGSSVVTLGMIAYLVYFNRKVAMLGSKRVRGGPAGRPLNGHNGV